MQVKHNRQYEQSHHAQEYPPPTQPVYVTSGSGAIVVITIFLFSVVVMYMVSRNSQSAWSGVWGTVIFFSLALPVGLMAANGSIAAMFNGLQEQITIRKANELAAMPRDAWQVVESPQPPRIAPASPLPLTSSTFVPPVAEVDTSTQREAVAWVLQLYGRDGQPDPDKVLLETEKERPGRIRIARPSKAATQWLLDKYVIHSVGNGYLLNLPRCPTMRAAQQMLESPNGVGAYPRGEGYPTHHPSESGAA